MPFWRVLFDFPSLPTSALQGARGVGFWAGCGLSGFLPDVADGVFGEFEDGDDGGGDGGGGEPVVPGEGDGSEQGFEGGDLGDGDEEAEFPEDGEVEPAVGEGFVEYGSAFGSEVIGFEEFDEDEAAEDHGHGFGERLALLQEQVKQAVVDACGPEAADEHEEDDGFAEDAFAGFPGWLFHEVFVDGVEGEGECREAVGGEVDVEDLDGA